MNLNFPLSKNNSINKPTLMSFFHGVGGMVIGAERAGFNHIYASDYWKASEKFHSMNHKGSLYHLADFRNLELKDIIAHGQQNDISIVPGDVDFIMAGTPCPGWSKVNRWRYTFDRRNFLMTKQIRLGCSQGLKAKVVCLEQVPGFFDRQMLPMRMEVFAALNAQTDYWWRIKVLNSVDYGANQSRCRVIVLLVRKDIGKPSFPEPFPVNLNDISVHNLLPGVTDFKMNGDEDAIIYNAENNSFRTLTATGGEFVKDAKGWRPLSTQERIKLSHLEGFDFSGFSDPEITRLIGNMVQIPFAEAISKHVLTNILSNSDTSETSISLAA